VFTIVWVCAVSFLAVAWIAYWIWNYVQDQREKKQPKAGTKHLSQVKQSFEEYTRKVENYKKPTYKRKK